MKYTIIYEKYFNDSEKQKIAEYVEKNINDFEDLKKGENFIDVSEAIKRTSWVYVVID